MNLDDNERKWLQDHLAHNHETHENFYRKHDCSIELSKIGAYLLTVSEGKLVDYAGKRMSDISSNGKYCSLPKRAACDM